ncbi:MAG: hypothetical protein IPO88_31465 [Nannocystis sp.]|uniref:hypothetical protein n=1 Tax=Nannocystis sp. TaxID=1962667 RepID=UPI0024212844|nr:hypothetical protein [Nannocystis sp.]MBK9757955.1 hypothetical protein [Nannocystis sp.]
MVGGVWSWLVVAVCSPLVIACAPPCVDDGLHGKQGGAGCVAPTTGSGGGSSSTGAGTGTGAGTDAATGTGTGTGTGDTATTTAVADTSTGGVSATGTGEPTTSGDTGGSTGSSTGVPTCSDGVMNGTESDADCGGSCPQCDDLLKCGVPGDCMSQICHAVGVCVPASCTDGVYDSNAEEYLDCGFMCGPTCGLGFPCSGKGDCAAGDCFNNTCQLHPHCANGMFDPGLEAELDCGGECGKTCKPGSSCTSNADCYTVCVDDVVCDGPASCFNQAQDPGETDLDCGGICFGCAPQQVCIFDGDCFGGNCVGQLCM